MPDSKHKNYYTLNLKGYGLAKFGALFVKQMGFQTKQAFYKHIIHIGVSETTGVVKNRQDLFDPFFDNHRKGWWQKGNTYIHRKEFIDSLFGELNAEEYAGIVALHLETEFGGGTKKEAETKPILKSKFKQLQLTGKEAELYFIHNFKEIDWFQNGVLEDARLFGDGYDFQIQVDSRYYLAEVKGVRETAGNIRLTEREFEKAKEYQGDYALSIVSNLNDHPKISIVFDPIKQIEFSKRMTNCRQLSYHSKAVTW